MTSGKGFAVRLAGALQLPPEGSLDSQPRKTRRVDHRGKGGVEAGECGVGEMPSSDAEAKAEYRSSPRQAEGEPSPLPVYSGAGPFIVNGAHSQVSVERPQPSLACPLMSAPEGTT